MNDKVVLIASRSAAVFAVLAVSLGAVACGEKKPAGEAAVNKPKFDPKASLANAQAERDKANADAAEKSKADTEIATLKVANKVVKSIVPGRLAADMSKVTCTYIEVVFASALADGKLAEEERKWVSIRLLALTEEQLPAVLGAAVKRTFKPAEIRALVGARVPAALGAKMPQWRLTVGDEVEVFKLHIRNAVRDEFGKKLAGGSTANVNVAKINAALNLAYDFVKDVNRKTLKKMLFDKVRQRVTQPSVELSSEETSEIKRMVLHDLRAFPIAITAAGLQKAAESKLAMYQAPDAKIKLRPLHYEALNGWVETTASSIAKRFKGRSTAKKPADG